MSPKKRPATYDDLRRLPPHLVGEIIDGELVARPRPASPHARAASIAGADLIGSFDGQGGGRGPGGWWIIVEPELHLGPQIVVPDLAGWRRERMPRVPDVPAFELAPDWICEIASPSTERIDRARKMRVYAEARVGHLWIVNPRLHTVEVYRLEARAEGPRWLVVDTLEGEGKARIEPFDAVELELGRWWIDAEPPASHAE